MKISNDVRDQIFAQYLGQKVLHIGIEIVDLDKSWNWKHPSFKLVLIPLSKISDEDAIEVAKIVYEDNKGLNTSQTGRDIIRGTIREGFVYIRESYLITQFLQSKGYDLPQYLLGGKTLIESGLAIDKTLI